MFLNIVIKFRIRKCCIMQLTNMLMANIVILKQHHYYCENHKSLLSLMRMIMLLLLSQMKDFKCLRYIKVQNKKQSSIIKIFEFLMNRKSQLIFLNVMEQQRHLFALFFPNYKHQSMKYLLLFTFLTLSVCFNLIEETQLSAVNYPFAICGNGTWTMKNLTLSQPPGRNVDIQIVASGIANDQIQFKSVELYIKVNGLFLHSESIPFNQVVDSGDIVQFSFHSFVPSFAPAGTYIMSFTHKDTSGKDNGCWSFTFKF